MEERRGTRAFALTLLSNGLDRTVHKNRDMISLDQDTNGRDGLFTSF